MPTELQAPPRAELAPVTPMQLIERASANGASIEQMQQLFELKLRVEADEARKAFNRAMAEFKREPLRITKNKSVSFGGEGATAYKHATLDNVVDVIRPALTNVGIRHAWNFTQNESGWVSVTCTLSHEAGHSESVTLKAQVDSSGKKNAIQAVASTVTYLERYTLLAATGVAVVGTDDDAAGGKGDKPGMSQEQYAHFLEAIEGAATPDALKKAFAPAFTAAANIGDQAALAAFTKAKDKRKSEL